MMPMATCASAGGGIHFAVRRRRSGGAGAAAVAKGVVFVCKNLCSCAKMAVYTVRITGWALKRKS
jgi:hypothetical protein